MSEPRGNRGSQTITWAALEARRHGRPDGGGDVASALFDATPFEPEPLALPSIHHGADDAVVVDWQLVQCSRNATLR